MPAKSCRHVALALRLSDFRRALKAREVFSCDVCAKQQEVGTSEDARRSWERSAAWDDLCACVTCGFVACLSANHFAQHMQQHAKHFVGFYAGAQSFWCSPCKREISDAKSKVEDARRECQDAFDEIANKQQRRLRTRVAIAAAKPALKAKVSPVAALENGEENAEHDKQREKTAAKKSSTRSLKSADGGEAEKQQQKKKKEKESGPLAATAASLRAVSSVLGFTNVGNTCYFNAAIQALLTAAHYFPEHVHYAETLEVPNAPILMTFSMLHETIKKKTRRRSASSAATTTEKDVKTKGKSRREDDRPEGVLTVAPLLKEMRKKFAQFRGSYQQDAHELLLSFLWAIDEEADPPTVSSSSSSSSSTSSTTCTTVSSGGDTSDTSGAVSPSASSSSSAPAADDMQSNSNAMKQIFVKTDVGDTISMHVPLTATLSELQQLIAKRLNISESDMALAHARPSGVTSSCKSETQAPQSFSKLNFTRNLFGGELTTAITCQSCGNESKTAEDAFQLSLPVPSSTSARSLTTIDCLQHFMSETELLVAAKNGYDCEKCSRNSKKGAAAPASANEVALRDAKMRLVVSQLPRVLVIHLKRLGRLKKVTQHIQFDSFMDMAPYTDASARTAPTCYELVAVIVHMGNKRSGHYVAYVSRSKKRDAQTAIGRKADDGTAAAVQLDSDDDLDPRAEIHTSENPSRSWYYISDTLVKRVTFEQVLQCEAYMLFYRQLQETTSSIDDS